ncbi:hypothetical protein C4K19_3140 [Pseudomonas chlororaphis subsp. aurantiaca]|nr:hypothetical protein C4K19_3140 [Pseudomonas chlororaphis subsp. aurantiaca]
MHPADTQPHHSPAPPAPTLDGNARQDNHPGSWLPIIMDT